MLVIKKIFVSYLVFSILNWILPKGFTIAIMTYYVVGFVYAWMFIVMDSTPASEYKRSKIRTIALFCTGYFLIDDLISFIHRQLP